MTHYHCLTDAAIIRLDTFSLTYLRTYGYVHMSLMRGKAPLTTCGLPASKQRTSVAVSPANFHKRLTVGPALEPCPACALLLLSQQD